MNCGSFPMCSLDCTKCSECKEQDNTPKDDYAEYIEDIEADAYLSSMEFHEERFIA